MKEVYYLKQFLKRHFPFGSVSPHIIIIASNICPVGYESRNSAHVDTGEYGNWFCKYFKGQLLSFSSL